MNKQLHKHEKNDRVKWILTLMGFLLIGIMLMGILFGWMPRVEDEKQGEQSEIIYQMPMEMIFSEKALASAYVNNNDCVSARIEVYVYPENAVNKAIDFSVAWGKVSINSGKSVSEFIKVIPDYDGSTLATVSCYKAFPGETIIITARSRDTGVTATCTVYFVGVATAMDITSDNAILSYSVEKGEYYALKTGGNKYVFNLDLSNSFNSVGTADFIYSVEAVGSLYVGKGLSDASSGYYHFSEYQEKPLSFFQDYVLQNITLDNSARTISITTNESGISEYYSSTEQDDSGWCQLYYDRFVFYDEWGFTIGIDYEETALENIEKLRSCYFNITVTERKSNITQSFKVWVEQTVESINFAKNIVEI